MALEGAPFFFFLGGGISKGNQREHQSFPCCGFFEGTPHRICGVCAAALVFGAAALVFGALFFALPLLGSDCLVLATEGAAIATEASALAITAAEVAWRQDGKRVPLTRVGGSCHDGLVLALLQPEIEARPCELRSTARRGNLIAHSLILMAFVITGCHRLTQCAHLHTTECKHGSNFQKYLVTPSHAGK